MKVYALSDTITRRGKYYVVAESQAEALEKGKKDPNPMYFSEEEIAPQTTIEHEIQPILLRCIPDLLLLSPREVWILPITDDASWRDNARFFYGYLLDAENQVVSGGERSWPREIWEEAQPDVVRQQIGLSYSHFHHSCFAVIYGEAFVAQLLASECAIEHGSALYSMCFSCECSHDDLCLICAERIRFSLISW